MIYRQAAMSLLHRGRQVLRDRRGIAAIEFALLAPLLILLYFVTMEAGQAIEVNRKVNRVAGMVGDLVTQQGVVTPADLDAIMRIGEATLQPYNRSPATISITGIAISDEEPPTVRVVWSRKLEDGEFGVDEAKDTNVVIPEALRIRNSFLVRAESRLAYEPVVATSLGEGFSMGETFYLRPRMSRTIDCAGC